MKFVPRRISAVVAAACALSSAAPHAPAVEEAHLLCRHLAAPRDESSGGVRQFAPDRRADILHLTLNVTPDFKARTVRGTAAFKFQPIGQPLEQLRLDAVELRVKSVKSSARIAAWQADDAVPCFPHLDADIEVASFGSMTQVHLVGHYGLPGQLDQWTLETSAMHRATVVAIRSYLLMLGEVLETGCSSVGITASSVHHR